MTLTDLAASAAAVKALWLHRIDPNVDMATVYAVLGDVAELADRLPGLVDQLAGTMRDLDDPPLDAALVDAAASARHVAQILDNALDRVHQHRSQDRSHERSAPRPAPHRHTTLSGTQRPSRRARSRDKLLQVALSATCGPGTGPPQSAVHSVARSSLATIDPPDCEAVVTGR